MGLLTWNSLTFSFLFFPLTLILKSIFAKCSVAFWVNIIFILIYYNVALCLFGFHGFWWKMHSYSTNYSFISSVLWFCSCFQEFCFVFNFYFFDYDVSGCGYLWHILWGFSELLESVSLCGLIYLPYLKVFSIYNTCICKFSNLRSFQNTYISDIYSYTHIHMTESW